MKWEKYHSRDTIFEKSGERTDEVHDLANKHIQECMEGNLGYVLISQTIIDGRVDYVITGANVTVEVMEDMMTCFSDYVLYFLMTATVEKDPDEKAN